MRPVGSVMIGLLVLLVGLLPLALGLVAWQVLTRDDRNRPRGGSPPPPPPDPTPTPVRPVRSRGVRRPADPRGPMASRRSERRPVPAH